MSKFKDDEIQKHIHRTATRRKNVDYDRQELMAELKRLALRGDENEFEMKLRSMGIQRGTPQWQQAKRAYDAFQQIR